MGTGAGVSAVGVGLAVGVFVGVGLAVGVFVGVGVAVGVFVGVGLAVGVFVGVGVGVGAVLNPEHLVLGVVALRTVGLDCQLDVETLHVCGSIPVKSRV